MKANVRKTVITSYSIHYTKLYERVAHRWEVGCAAVARALFVAEAPFGLSAQEYRAAKLAADGLSNQEIASVLSLSLNTVKTHLKAVYRESGANSRPTLRKLLKTL